MAELQRDGVTAKQRVTKKGKVVGGGAFTRGPLYYLLSNPAYIGVTRHKEKRYPDTHPAIIDQAMWERVQVQLKRTNGRQHPTPRRSDEPLFRGLLFDDRGKEMVPTHTTKGSKRYRYYVSRSVMEGEVTRAGSDGSQLVWSSTCWPTSWNPTSRALDARRRSGGTTSRGPRRRQSARWCVRGQAKAGRFCRRGGPGAIPASQEAGRHCPIS
jgi:hypothetical protein